MNAELLREVGLLQTLAAVVMRYGHVSEDGQSFMVEIPYEDIVAIKKANTHEIGVNVEPLSKSLQVVVSALSRETKNGIHSTDQSRGSASEHAGFPAPCQYHRVSPSN